MPGCKAHPTRGARSLRSRGRMGAAGTYAQACFKLGCPPDPIVLRELAQDAALSLDLRLAKTLISAVCATLRGQPPGIRQIILRDGMHCFGHDAAYRKQAAAAAKTQGSALHTAPLRLLMTALAVFLTAQGHRVEVLDLAGLPLGKELTSLLGPIAATLGQCRARNLQWLNLSGCGVGDRGLALLLPWLCSAPQLSALLLAQNRLSDTRLLDRFLRARGQLCGSHGAAPLQLLDLSQNHLLVTRHAEYGALGASGVPAKAERTGVLVQLISRALAAGLPLEVLRLQHLQLKDSDLIPLLRFLHAEAGKVPSGNGIWTLRHIELSGNSVSSQVQQDISDAIALLQFLHSQERPSLGSRKREPEQAPALQKACSEPCESPDRAHDVVDTLSDSECTRDPRGSRGSVLNRRQDVQSFKLDAACLQEAKRCTAQLEHTFVDEVTAPTSTAHSLGVRQVLLDLLQGNNDWARAKAEANFTSTDSPEFMDDSIRASHTTGLSDAFFLDLPALPSPEPPEPPEPSASEAETPKGPEFGALDELGARLGSASQLPLETWPTGPLQDMHREAINDLCGRRLNWLE
ncbi:unnamed protein product, partial [Effrenium voratum]